MERSPFIALAAGAWLGLCLVSGCNLALGIEKASPSGTPDVIQPNKIYTGGNQCFGNVLPDCTDCLASSPGSQSAHCATDLSQCLANRPCRKVFDQYNICLQKSCRPDPGNCFEPLFDTGKETPECISSNCFDRCKNSPVATPCQLYCSCMGANCAGKYKTTEACMNACGALDPDLVTCRRTHCEIAADDPKFGHCDHAVGVGNCQAKPARDQECGDKSLLTFACTTDDECCSSNCNRELKACAPQ